MTIITTCHSFSFSNHSRWPVLIITLPLACSFALGTLSSLLPKYSPLRFLILYHLPLPLPLPSFPFPPASRVFPAWTPHLTLTSQILLLARLSLQ